MTNPFLGQIQAFAFGLVPQGWMACSGQSLSVNQNQALFSLLGTTYGGNGTTTFNLPNLQGASIVSPGPGFVLGQVGGEVNHTLTSGEMPAHVHPMIGSSATAPTTPVSPISGTLPGVVGLGPIYGSTPDTTLGTGSSSAGGGQPHTNMQPFLAISYCIAISGTYPSRN